MAVIHEMCCGGTTVRIHDDYMPKNTTEAESVMLRMSNIVGAAEIRIAGFLAEQKKIKSKAC